jgi:L-threonylcarbamoyladenylate synthase
MKLYTTQVFQEEDLIQAAEYLLSGEVVAFPTETVYGLGACIFLEDAIKKIFYAKRRPSDNPLIAHISDLSSVESIAEDVPPLFYKIAEEFFPGPLTIIASKSSEVPSIASAGLSTIAIRMPNHKIALRLIELVGQPMVAPSANLSGKPSATDFTHVLEDFDGHIPGDVKGEPSSIGIP